MIILRNFFFTLLLSAPAVLNAHHSTALNFSQEIISVEGAIMSTNWVNPHCSFMLEVTNEDGGTENWLVTMLARIALERQGYNLDELQVGSIVKVTGLLGYRPNNIYSRATQLPDGRVLESRSPTR